MDDASAIGVPARVTHSGLTFKSSKETSGIVSCCIDGRNVPQTLPFRAILSAKCVSPSTGVWDVAYVQQVTKPFTLERKRFRLKGSGDVPVDGSAPLFDAPPPKRLVVLVNPKSGPGKAGENWEKYARPVFEAAGIVMRVIETKYSKEAVELVADLRIEDWDGIVCVSGDGLPHEVLNGLASRPDAKEALAHFAIAQLPGGSGNALTYSINEGVGEWAAAALNIIKGSSQPLDLMLMTQGTNKFWSFLSTSFGIVADCDLGTEDWRWMGGARFTVGIVIKCVAQNTYPCDVSFKLATPGDGNEHSRNYYEAHAATEPTFSGSLEPQYGTINDDLDQTWTTERHPNLSMFYVGNMPWMSGDAMCFPLAHPSDGAMDLFMWDTDMGRAGALQTLLKFETGKHVDDVRYRKILAFRLVPKQKDAYLSIDGESYPCEPIQGELIAAAGRYFAAPP